MSAKRGEESIREAAAGLRRLPANPVHLLKRLVELMKILVAQLRELCAQVRDTLGSKCWPELVQGTRHSRCKGRATGCAQREELRTTVDARDSDWQGRLCNGQAAVSEKGRQQLVQRAGGGQYRLRVWAELD